MASTLCSNKFSPTTPALSYLTRYGPRFIRMPVSAPIWHRQDEINELGLYRHTPSPTRWPTDIDCDAAQAHLMSLHRDAIPIYTTELSLPTLDNMIHFF